MPNALEGTVEDYYSNIHLLLLSITKLLHADYITR